MRVFYRFVPVFALLAVCCLVSAAWSSTQKPAPVIESIGTASKIDRIAVGSPQSTSALCQLGVNGAPAFLIDYLFPPDDQYLTLINPADCPSCPSLMLTTAHALFQFRSVCSMPVTISIVGAIDNGSGCFEPNPEDVVCLPATYLLAPPATGIWDFSMALPPGCCINGPVFLVVNVNSFGTCPNTSTLRPRLVTTGNCDPCVSWNIYGGGVYEDELCGVGFPGNPIMYADADCCGATPTRSGTWGRIKTMYR